jgi:hypothetical protein
MWTKPFSQVCSTADARPHTGTARATALVDALKDPDIIVQQSAADALQDISLAAADAVPALADALKDPNIFIRWDVANEPLGTIIRWDVADALRDISIGVFEGCDEPGPLQIRA